jgi:hypothetical protein
MENKIKDVLWEVSYIKLAMVESGVYCLIVEDTELNDYVEDFLWDEYKFQATSVEMEAGSSVAVYYNYFDREVPLERIVESLKQLNLNEVERIYRLNN